MERDQRRWQSLVEAWTREVVGLCKLEHITGGACNIANVSVLEVGFLQVIDEEVKGWV